MTKKREITVKKRGSLLNDTEGGDKIGEASIGREIRSDNALEIWRRYYEEANTESAYDVLRSGMFRTNAGICERGTDIDGGND